MCWFIILLRSADGTFAAAELEHGEQLADDTGQPFPDGDAEVHSPAAAVIRGGVGGIGGRFGRDLWQDNGGFIRDLPGSGGVRKVFAADGADPVFLVALGLGGGRFISHVRHAVGGRDHDISFGDWGAAGCVSEIRAAGFAVPVFNVAIVAGDGHGRTAPAGHMKGCVVRAARRFRVHVDQREGVAGGGDGEIVDHVLFRVKVVAAHGAGVVALGSGSGAGGRRFFDPFAEAVLQHRDHQRIELHAVRVEIVAAVFAGLVGFHALFGAGGGYFAHHLAEFVGVLVVQNGGFVQSFAAERIREVFAAGAAVPVFGVAVRHAGGRFVCHVLRHVVRAVFGILFFGGAAGGAGEFPRARGYWRRLCCAGYR